MSVTTWNILSQTLCFDLSHCFAILSRDIKFFCCNESSGPSKLTLDFVSRHSCLLSRQSFSAIFNSLCRDRVVRCHDMSCIAMCLISVVT